MTLAIAPALQQARLAATLAALGSGARVRIHGGERPIAGADAPAPALAEVPLANPPGVIAGGKIVLAAADPKGVLIAHTGQAAWARIVDGAGQWLLDCDVSGPAGAGDWQLAIDGLPADAPPTQMYEGGTFTLGTVTLA